MHVRKPDHRIRAGDRAARCAAAAAYCRSAILPMDHQVGLCKERAVLMMRGAAGERYQPLNLAPQERKEKRQITVLFSDSAVKSDRL